MKNLMNLSMSETFKTGVSGTDPSWFIVSSTFSVNFENEAFIEEAFA